MPPAASCQLVVPCASSITPESVDAQSVLESDGVLASCEIVGVAPSVESRSPHVELVRSPVAPPSLPQSPHAGLLNAVVNSGQFASRYDWLPPSSSVRHTCWKPVYIVPAATGSVS